jgi:hypothetical protein
MNVKPGDLCLVLRGANGRNAGKTVTAIRLLGDDEHTSRGQGPIWLVDREMSFMNGFGERNWFPWVPDKCLLPINPDDQHQEVETDETATV